MCHKHFNWILLFEIFLFCVCSSSPTDASFDSKLSSLESELEDVKHIVHEMLESVNKLSKESLVSQAELEQMKADINSEGRRIDIITEKAEEAGNVENVERRFQMMFQTIRDSKDSMSAVMEDAMSSVDAKMDALKEDIVDKLVNIVRQETRKFVTEDAIEELARQVQDLDNLPQSINASMSQSLSNMTADLSSRTISRQEFYAFQLSVARDTCKSRFEEGHWVVVQRRGQFGNPPDYFSRDMAEYVSGFGEPSAEFWLGLDKILLLTAGGAELRIELETFEGKSIFASYSTFRLEGEDYKIHVGGYEGNAGDPMRDNDRDQWVGDCSNIRGNGGWWFNGCGLANLNGINYGENAKSYDGIIWYFYERDNRSFKSSQMMIRKRS